MTVLRMDHVSVVVEDLATATAFFEALGLEVEGTAPIEGEWVDRISGISDLRCDIVMMRTADGHGKLELTGFRNPPPITPQPDNAMSNVLGLRSVMFAVDDLEATVDRLREHGGELIGEIVQYEHSYRLCYMRGPAGIIVALAKPLAE